jgi:hypothetical protein
MLGFYLSGIVELRVEIRVFGNRKFVREKFLHELSSWQDRRYQKMMQPTRQIIIDYTVHYKSETFSTH